MANQNLKGGLALANILQNRGVPCIIVSGRIWLSFVHHLNAITFKYELEDSAEARVQGGSLDMGKFGLHALEQAGLMKQFISIARPEGDALFIAGKDGKVHIAQPPPDADQSTKPAEKSPPEAGEGPFPEGVRPEVDRGMLRQLLLNNLKQGTIKWGHKLQSITHATDRSPVHELIFGNGVTISADLVVGADGAWSHVRPLVSSARPEYTGVSMVEVRVDRVDELHPSIAKMVGPGAFLAFDTNKGLMAQRNATSVRTYATLRVPEDWAKTCGIPFETNPGEAKQKLLEYYEGWAPELRKLIEVCNDSVIPRGIYRLPMEMKWEHTPGVTVRSFNLLTCIVTDDTYLHGSCWVIVRI